jgi:acyl phosphate:glycerol-3-phosphate acyltransferase
LKIFDESMSMNVWMLVGIAIVAYSIGSVSFAVVVSKAMKLSDPRSYGSGNPGATNVLRSGNKKAAIFTLLGDALKGCLAVWLAIFITMNIAPNDVDAKLLAIAISAVAVFLGHLYPMFHGFKGGKGVATAAGVLLVINPLLGLATLCTWLAIVAFFRYSSAAALAAAVFAPFYYVLLFGTNVIAAAVIFICLLLIWRHRGNIKQLLAGTESRIGKR